MKRWALFFALLIVIGAPAGAVANGNGDTDDFRLGGTAAHALDPENSANEVIRIRTDVTPFFGTVARDLNVKIDKLDSMLEFKSYFVTPKTCIGGSPRMALLVDADGDGDFQQSPASADFAAQGHVNPPAFAGCLMNTWLFDSLTDNQERWEVTPSTAFAPPCNGPIGGLTDCKWDDFEARVMTGFPNHNVCTGFLVDDTFGAPGMTGTAYYDLISVGNETWTEFDDTGGRRQGCRQPEDDDDDDGDVDNGDFDDDDNDNEPDDWDKDDNSVDAGSTSYGANGVNGSKAVSITGNGGTALLQGSPTWTSAPFAVSPGLLDLRVWTKSSGLSSAPTVGIAFLGPAGQVLSKVTAITAPLSTDSFEKLVSTVVVPSGIAKARVVLTGFSPLDTATAGTVTFDKVGVYRSPLNR